jgi:uncharacterized glyoxalase superfamily protein PhnB
MVIEVEDAGKTYRRAIEKGLPIQQPLTTHAWGHRGFCVREPNGLTLFFFTEINEGVAAQQPHAGDGGRVEG